jgi:outer membrane protein assembly factor BamB
MNLVDTYKKLDIIKFGETRLIHINLIFATFLLTACASDTQIPTITITSNLPQAKPTSTFYEEPLEKVADEIIQVTEIAPTQEVVELQPEPIWVYEFTGRSHSRPTISQGILYVGRAGTYEGGSLLALDAATGELLWEFETTGHVPSSPTIVGDVVYFATLNGLVYALEADSGHEIWNVDSGNRIRSSPAIYNDLIIFGSYILGGGGGEVFALDLVDGSSTWTLTTENFFFESSPVVINDLILIGNTDGNLYALDARDGTAKWTYLAGDPSLRQHPLSYRRAVLSTPAVLNGVVYISSNDGSLHAIRLEDQHLIWKTEIGNSEGFSTVKYSISSPIVVEDRIYVGSNNGKVFALDASDGTIQWEYQTESWVWSKPAYDNGLIYIGSDDRFLYALDAGSGDLVWKYDTGTGFLDREVLSGIWGDPLIASGMVLVSSQNGRIHALSTNE